MYPQIPESVSYDSLLEVLEDRIATGDVPDDNEYFAELLLGLYKRANLTQQLSEKRTNQADEEFELVIEFVPFFDGTDN